MIFRVFYVIPACLGMVVDTPILVSVASNNGLVLTLLISAHKILIYCRSMMSLQKRKSAPWWSAPQTIGFEQNISKTATVRARLEDDGERISLHASFQY